MFLSYGMHNKNGQLGFILIGSLKGAGIFGIISTMLMFCI